jgi:hypothetical protein
MTEGRNYARGMALFATHHLSTYAVVCEKAESVPTTPGDSAENAEQGGSGGGGGCDAGAGAIVLFALAIAATQRRRNQG